MAQRAIQNLSFLVAMGPVDAEGFGLLRLPQGLAGRHTPQPGVLQLETWRQCFIQE